MAQLQATGITGSLTVLGSITGSLQSQEYELITKTIADGTPIGIDFTLDSSTYKMYKLIVTDFGGPAAAGSTNWAPIRLSSNSGSTFQTIEYVIQVIQSASVGTPSGNSSGTQVFLTNSTLNSTTRLTGEVLITMQPHILVQSNIVGNNSTPRLTNWLSFHRVTDAALSNFLRVQWQTGTAQGITGSFYLMGLRK